MRRADQVSGLVLLVFGLWFAVTAWREHPYWTPTGPGSGFLPVWLGVAMAALAAMLFVGATRRADAGPAWLPGGRVLVRVVAVVVAIVVLIVLMPWLGMTLGTALFLVAILRFLEGHGWRTALAVAVAAAGANWLVFAYWLRVPFPVGVLGF
jgi:putative tricarboxylic transport membrane protein